jgi:uncharacterized membrane protein
MLRRPNSTSERLEAFSDAVIAIAITLLVLHIRVPETERGDLFDALVDQWPSYMAFIISFITIGLMWVSHHTMFERIATVDRGLLFVNLLLLMGIAFLPWPTSLVAEYVQEGGTNSSVAVAIYSTNMVAIGVAFSLMWWYLSTHPWIVVEGLTQERVRSAFNRSLVSPIVYGFTIGLAFVSPEACFVVYALIALYFVAGPSARAAQPTTPSPDIDEL